MSWRIDPCEQVVLETAKTYCEPKGFPGLSYTYRRENWSTDLAAVGCSNDRSSSLWPFVLSNRCRTTYVARTSPTPGKTKTTNVNKRITKFQLHLYGTTQSGGCRLSRVLILAAVYPESLTPSAQLPKIITPWARISRDPRDCEDRRSCSNGNLSPVSTGDDSQHEWDCIISVLQFVLFANLFDSWSVSPSNDRTIFCAWSDSRPIIEEHSLNSERRVKRLHKLLDGILTHLPTGIQYQIQSRILPGALHPSHSHRNRSWRFLRW